MSYCKMWLEKLFIIYLLTLFNSMDGYFLDNQIKSTGRHRRKGKSSLNKISSLGKFIQKIKFVWIYWKMNNEKLPQVKISENLNKLYEILNIFTWNVKALLLTQKLFHRVYFFTLYQLIFQLIFLAALTLKKLFHATSIKINKLFDDFWGLHRIPLES